MNMKLQTNERGFATLIALIMVAMLTILGLAALSTSDDEMTIATNEIQEMKAFYAAEAGLEAAAATMQTEYDSTGLPPLVLPSGHDTINQCNVVYRTVDNGPASQEILTNGTLAGLHALVKSFAITSTATNDAEHSAVEVSQSFEAALVPLFQFAVFYGNDLEIAPGPEMRLIGRVHSNGNLYVQANSTLRMDSYVTASGDILHGRKGPGSVGSGDVQIKDAEGNYISMQMGASWMDASDPDWYDSSVARWQGRVQDNAHGQSELNVPLAGGAGGDPHKLIERATGNPDSYEDKASLKIIDRQAYQKVGGVWTNVTADMVSKGILTFNNDQFYDAREGEWVDPVEVDVAKLYSEGYGPANGVIYASDQTTDYPALRLTNGAELGAGLSVASENPVYTVGDYNSVDKKPASILADAVTYLSGAWDDSKSSSFYTKYDRPADNTVVNCSYLTGNVETTSTDYSGGFENLPRFLEDWAGKTMSWSGSAVNLWVSRQATGTWSGSYYNPPNRDWQYDTDLDDPHKLPPETPVVRVFQRTGWKMENVGYGQGA